MSRRKRVLMSLAAGTVAATVGLGAAWAQTGEQPAEGAGEVDVQRRAALTGPEQLAEANRIGSRGNQISRRIASMLDEAKTERDVIRATCLDDKLSQVNANLRILETRYNSLRGASQSGNESLRNHEYTVITVLGEKFNVLEQEAQQCIGQDIYDTGATRVVVDIDPASPDENPTEIANPPDVEVPYIPPPASPTD